MSLPLPPKLPNGVRITGISRGSLGEKFGKDDQLFGAQTPPGINRSSMPCVTWPTLPPVWVLTHAHGCGVPQRALYAGHENDVLIVYVGRHPFASSVRMFG